MYPHFCASSVVSKLQVKAALEASTTLTQTRHALQCIQTTLCRATALRPKPATQPTS